MFLIDDILLAPITGFQFIMRTLAKAAEEQYTDDAPLKERLMELQVLLDQGDVSEEEYVEQEAQILRALREIQERKIQMAGGNVEDAASGLTGKVSGEVSANLTYGQTSSDKK
jgi:cytochrome c-type biogenesis protein CcmH/NrfG